MLAFILTGMGRQWKDLSRERIYLFKSLALAMILKPHSSGKDVPTGKPTGRLLYSSDERLW